MLRVLLAVLLFVLIIPALLYVPPIQQWVKNIALEQVRKSTGMDIRIGYLSLRFPLKVRLDDVMIIEASGDTMVTAGSASLRVSPLPLLRLNVDIAGVELEQGSYRLGAPDSTMYLTARVDRFVLDAADLQLKKGVIDLESAQLNGGDVRLQLRPDTTVTPTDTAGATPWHIHAAKIALNDVRFRMSMMPTIDSLDVALSNATLTEGVVDMASHSIAAQELAVKIATATYLTPATKPTAATTAALPDTIATEASEQWTVTAERLRLQADTATYAMRGAIPAPGLDMNYLQATAVAIAVDSFYNRGTTITVPLKQLTAHERCGVALNASGTFAMDSATMQARDFSVATAYSSFSINALLGVGDMIGDPSLPLSLIARGGLAIEDVEMAMPALKPMLRDVPRGAPVRLNADINGTAGQLRVEELAVNWPRFLTFDARGTVNSPFDPEAIGGRINFAADAIGLNAVKPTLLDARLSRQLNIPHIKIDGAVNYSPGLAAGKIRAITGGGNLALDGNWNQRAEGYDVHLTADRFPVDAFMPSLGVGNISARVSAVGKGYNPLSPRTNMDVDVDLLDAEYLSQPYRNISLQANLHNGEAHGTLTSTNTDLHAIVNFDATVADSGYTWNLTGDVPNIDLMAMKLSTTPLGGQLAIESRGTCSADMHRIDATLTARDIRWQLNTDILATDKVDATLNTTDTTVNLRLLNGDLDALIAAQCGLDSLLAHLTQTGAEVDTIVTHHKLNVDRLQHALPAMAAVVNAGTQNVVQSMLEARDMGFGSAQITFYNDSLMNLNGRVLRFVTGTTRLDTLGLGIIQHGRFLAYEAKMGNRRGNLDDFARVVVSGFVADDKMSVLLRQQNVEGKRGFLLGGGAEFSDTTVSARLVPFTPVIGYRDWTLNRDNFVKFNFLTKHLDANVRLSSGDSYLHLFTEHDDTTAMSPAGYEDVVLQMANINIADWLAVSPFAPPIKGTAGADMRFRWDTHALTGRGTLNLTDLFYGNERVGTFDIGLNLVNSTNGGGLHADAAVKVDGVEVITARGALNDTLSATPMLLDFSMIHLPLTIANPFLPKEYARMSGMLNGQMSVTGEMSAPRFNGFIDFDSAAVTVPMVGTRFAFSEEKIPVDSNIVNFNGFAIRGCNDNPLNVSGRVDLRSLSNIGIDLALKARNMQVVNSSRPRGAQLYGKGYINLDADVRGTMSFLNVDANLNVLAGTNVTYIVEESQSSLVSQSDDGMVEFVQFNDSSMVVRADSIAPPAMALNVDANLVVSQGSTINVSLPGNSQNRVVIQGQGDLTYSLNPFNDGRLTGQFTINNGSVRYVPPVISMLNFTITPGSYIAFTGDMLNPSLNLAATDKIKANVTQTGQNSRLVDFLVTVKALNTLQNLDVKFDLSTDNDLTISNELSSMTEQQRANQAMNLLLYNTYTGPDTKASSNLSGNPLFSFLTSQINSWAASNIKGVDISFGMDQYDTNTNGSSSTTTSYSYQVSKTLFNDRFKIIVGGNYSTDANADENFSENLISDVSFEYMLNKSGSMYVRLFRHTGYESILEGEVTQTGVGFVYKRKVRSLRDVFKFLLPSSRRRRKTTENISQQPATLPETTDTKTDRQ